MEETKDSATTAEPQVAQPEATGTPPAKSAAETKLEGQLAKAKKERDTARGEVTELRTQLDAAYKLVPLYDDPYAALPDEQFNTVLEIVLGEAHNRGIVTTQQDEAATTSTAPDAPAEPSQEEVIKDVLRRNNLKKCWMLPAGPQFSEAHAREYAGDDFDSLTVISID